MGIKRGQWNPESINKAAAIKTGRYGAKPAPIHATGVSNSEHHMSNRNVGSIVPAENVKGISDHRKEDLIRGTERNEESGTSLSAPVVVYSQSYKSSQEVKNKYGLNKTADIFSNSGMGTGNRLAPGARDTVRQAPEVYSPLFQIANLQLPRDRITMNAWNRNYYDTHPLVHNCINLHATYPINKLNIKCKDPDVERFFQEMCEEIDLMGILQNIALEFWKMGEKISESSLITMDDGTLKKIGEIKIGDQVITHLGNKKKVINIFKKPTNKVIEDHLKIFKLTIQGLPEPLIISGKHPILSTNKGYFVCDTPSCSRRGVRVLPGKQKCSNCGKNAKHNTVDPDFIFADEAKKGDVVYASFNKEVIDSNVFTEDLCYLMGYWLAEGCYCKAQRKDYVKLNGIKFCSYDKNFIQSVLEPLIEKCFGHSAKTYISKSSGFVKNKDKYDVWYEGEYKNGPGQAKFFLENCGEFSKNKKLSKTIMHLPVNKQLKLLAGFIDGDGSIDKNNGQAILRTSSKYLANQFLLILRRAGLRPTCSRVKDSYRIKIVANEAYHVFKDKLKTDKNNLLRIMKWNSSKTAIYKDWQLLKITKIEDITDEFSDEYMYDIEVEDDHSYIANGIAVHNCFPYAELDPDRGVWKNIYIQNPDYIHVKTSVLGGDPVISMRPDAALTRLVQSNAPADVQLRKQISEEIIHHIKKGNDIPLDNFHVSHLKMLSSPYDTRGTSVIVSVYKDIMLYDKLRESKFAQADNLVNPITLIKVGGNSEGEYRATPEVLEQWRQTFEAAQYDKDFKIISHAGVTVERIGASGAIIDISNDMNFIMDNILYGLMVPKAVLTQEGASFSSATVGLEVLKTRYEAFRNMMKQWLVRKVFAPISEIQGFYEYDDGDKKLIVPEVDWNQMILYDMNDYINSIQQLATDPQNPKVSMDTLYRSLGLNPDQEKRKIKQESIESVIRRKEQESLNQMSLATLRSLTSDSEIIEPTTAPLPGTPGAEDAGMPGGDPFGMGGGDMGLGGGGLGGGDMGLGGGDLGGPGGDLGGGGAPPPPAGGEI